MFSSKDESVNTANSSSNPSIDSLIKQSDEYYNSNNFTDSVFDKFLQEAESIAIKNNYDKQQIDIYNKVGKRYRHIAEFGQAIMFFQQSLSLATKIEDQKLKTYAIHNMAVAFRRIDDNAQALKLHLKALEWAESVKDTFLIVSSQNGIGNVYISYHDYEQAINYFQKSLKILNNGFSNRLSEAINNNNIGDCWLLLGNADSAKYYLEKSYQINIEIGSSVGQAICKNGLGNVSLHIGDFKEAIEYYNASLAINRESVSPYYIADNLKNLGNAYLQMNNFSLADKSLKEGLTITNEMGSRSQALDILENLSKLYNKNGKPQLALHYINEALAYKDSITKEITNQNVEGMNAIYKSEKQEREIVILKQQTDLNQLLMDRQRAIIITGLFLLLAGTIIALYVYRQFKLNQRFNKTIEIQHKSITDSIKYAERIQTALLPSFNSITPKVDDYFVLFRPKNVVSGDFYWTSDEGSKTIIATADCTGHGVPGAMMSMLGIAFLNEIVNNKGITEPNLILDILRDRIIKQLHQKEGNESSKDGMDISIYTIDHVNMKLQYAGSYIPLYIVRDNNFIILKADKMPIGYHWKESNFFSVQEFDLQEGDCIYSSSDGYYDQFGGENKKKFLIKNFKELLLENHKKPMTEQKVVLNSTIDDWKGTFEQIDDIMVVGLRI